MRLPRATHPYIPMRRGVVYLAAILDWATRRVLAWQLSNSMTVDFCLEAVDAAIRDYGVPEILNTDQGSQFTGTAFVDLVQQHGIQIGRINKWIRGFELPGDGF